MPDNKPSLEYSALNIPIPPIMYSVKPGVGSPSQGKEKDVPPSSSLDQWMKTFMPSMLSPSTESKSTYSSTPPDHPKTAFILNNRGEFSAVPYDSAKNKDFIEITGKNASEGGRLYVPTVKSPKRKTDKRKPKTDDADADADDADDTLEKPRVKDTNDYIFHIYVGSLSIIGLLILFRMIQKS
jgi:hypothetical protein